VLFDFGGVLADEGFKLGLKAIARRQGLDPEAFFEFAREAVFDTGYLTGRCDEAAYWRFLRQAHGLSDPDSALREEILSRFRLRPRMFELVGKLGQAGRRLAVLSDQTNWLDELNAGTPFFDRFELVLNSFHVGLHKRDPACFANAVRALAAAPERILFIDDAESNVALARARGLSAVLYQDQDSFEAELARFCPEIGE
jgi:putative hydrolase of the HAD superfamily